MSGGEVSTSSNESLSVQELENRDIEDMEVGLVQPYADEPPAHSSNDEEDLEEDADGLSPAVLRA